MNDRELLELAAKAAGYEWSKDIADHRDANGITGLWILDPLDTMWNPLKDSGDAFELAARLDMPTGFDNRFQDFGLCAYATYPTGPESCDSIMQNVDDAGGKEHALRRAIVRAAAEIGRAMEGA